MLCIASFIVLLFTSAISAKHRKLLKKAWECTTKRVTRKPCDSSFGEEVRNSILAPLAIRAPRLVKPVSGAITVFAWVTVISFIISLYLIFISILNLVAFGSCNRTNPDACSFSSAGCTIGNQQPTFLESIGNLDFGEAFINEFNTVREGFQALPNRFRHWEEADYLPLYASFKNGFNDDNPLAIEVIDPGCHFCADLFEKISDTGFYNYYNVTFIAYSIQTPDGPQFKHSELLTKYLVALQVMDANEVSTPGVNPRAWQLLGSIFPNQTFLNFDLTTTDDVTTWLYNELANTLGMSESEINQVVELTESEIVANAIASNRDLVDNNIRTITIPSVIFDNRLHLGVVSEENLLRAIERRSN